MAKKSGLRFIDKFDAGLLHGATHFVRKNFGWPGQEAVQVERSKVRTLVGLAEGTLNMIYGYQILPGAGGMVIKQVGITPRLLESYDEIYGEEGRV